MTYCNRCKKEIKNDEFKEHLISDTHLVPQHKNYCIFCEKNHDVLVSSDPTSKQHFNSEAHKKKRGRFDTFYS